jgi:hypothetical protein
MATTFMVRETDWMVAFVGIWPAKLKRMSARLGSVRPLAPAANCKLAPRLLVGKVENKVVSATG